MDLTGAVAAFFNFASTPVGQKLIEEVMALDKQLGAKVGNLLNHLHKQVTRPADPAAPTSDGAK